MHEKLPLICLIVVGSVMVMLALPIFSETFRKKGEGILSILGVTYLVALVIQEAIAIKYVPEDSFWFSKLIAAFSIAALVFVIRSTLLLRAKRRELRSLFLGRLQGSEIGHLDADALDILTKIYMKRALLPDDDEALKELREMARITVNKATMMAQSKKVIEHVADVWKPSVAHIYATYAVGVNKPGTDTFSEEADETMRAYKKQAEAIKETLIDEYPALTPVLENVEEEYTQTLESNWKVCARLMRFQ